MFLETIIGLAVLLFLGSIVLGLVKLAFAVILLPLKLMLVLSKGLLLLFFGLPLLLLGGLLLGAALPLVLAAVVVPAWLLGGLVCFLLP